MRVTHTEAYTIYSQCFSLNVHFYKVILISLSQKKHLKTKGGKPQMSTFEEAEKIIIFLFEDFSILLIL